jgi:hypothetical protein
MVLCAVLRVQVPAEVSAVVSQLQRVQPRMMADTVAMAEALEGLTVTHWEAWAGLLVELSLETNRKLLSLRVGSTHMLVLVLKQCSWFVRVDPCF